jgi:hypothetical protein
MMHLTYINRNKLNDRRNNTEKIRERNYFKGKMQMQAKGPAPEDVHADNFSKNIA